MKEVKEPEDQEEVQPPVPKKKRKSEPEVTIAPSQPGGPDVTID